ncbi:MAG: pyridoxamine 5'-phosphate oxidase, partial [Alphaproteobacteria bacterium]|nr:pyridoxamine 5'-phosphate oxidase [Alphaproteobacteria bacterium]
VLLKGVDPTGIVFYTNLESRKGTHLAADPRAALCLYWKTLRRQIRVEGAVVAVSSDEADAYFASRDRGSQIGAWASHQSATLVSRAQLEADVADTQQRFGDTDVPRPAFWSGYRLMPDLIEFWWELPSRLHERVEFRRSATGDWGHRLLYP